MNITKKRKLPWHTAFIEWFCAIVAFLGLKPYLIWYSYHGIWETDKIIILLDLICIAVLLFRLLITVEKFKTYKLVGAICVIFCGCWLCFVSANSINFRYELLIPFLAVSVILLQSDDVLGGICNKFVKIYIAFLIPGIIIYGFGSLGVAIPTTILQSDISEKVSVGFSYQKSFLLLKTNNSLLNVVEFNRFQGVFDEPGVMGTITALLLCTRKYKLNNFANVILLIAGLLSVSIAFILITIIYFLIRSIQLKSMKSVAILSSIILAYTVFINVDFQNETIDSFQERIVFANGVLSGDNRATETAKMEFNNFLSNGGKVVWLGNGIYTATENANLVGGSSYRMLIYDNGYLGLLVYVLLLWIMNSTIRYSFKNKIIDDNALPFLVAFLASIYQRPYVFNFSNLVLFICGIEYCRKTNGIRDNGNLSVIKNRIIIKGIK